MGRKRSIHDHAADLYDDDELRNAVVEDAQRLGTVADIEAGRKVLPGPDDARDWLDRKLNRTRLTPEQQQQRERDRVKDEVLSELADLAVNPDPERAKILQQRIKELRTQQGDNS